MRCAGGGADVSPIQLSLVAFKPRQVILLEQKQQLRNSAGPTSMGKICSENPTQLKPEQDSILIYSIAMWLENKGFSKVLNHFLSAAKIQDDDWKAQALNLNEIFFKYQEICNDVHEDLKAQKNQDIALNGCINSAVSEAIESKKKKKKKKNTGEAVITDNGKSVDTIVIEKVKKSNANGKEENNNNATGVLSNSDTKSKLLEESNDAKVQAVPVGQQAKTRKEKRKKKSKLSLDSQVNKEKQIHVMADAAEEKHNGLVTINSDSKTDSEVIVEVKEKKKKRKLKDNSLNVDKDSDLESKNKVVLDKDAGGLELADNNVKMEKKMNENDIILSLELSGVELNGKSKNKSIDAAKDDAGESKKDSKKRKRLAADDNENQPGQELAVEESKPKKAKGLEEDKDVQAQVNGANGHAPNESSKDHLNIGVDNLNHSKSGRKQPTSSSKQPKTVNAFQRVKVDEVEFVDERLQDNSYWAKDGAESGYGAKAQEVLGQVKGRDFRHEKTKKKRGSYRGGQIDLQSHSIKFDNSDDE